MKERDTWGLAYLDAHRQLVELDADKGAHRHTGHEIWGTWNPHDNTACSWPTWSPDGRYIACFVHREQPQARRVAVFPCMGIQGEELVELDERLPIYLFWSPQGEHLAMLGQKASELCLSIIDPAAPSSARDLATASPLFFTWADAARLAVYLGNGSPIGGTLSLMDPRGTAPTTALPGVPGNFCAPLSLNGRIVYVAADEGGTHVVTAAPGDSQPQVLESVEGLVALVGSPDGQWIARACAPGGDGTPYRDLVLLDPATGERRSLHTKPCLAFFWTPTSEALLLARVDTDRNLLVWERLDLDGRTTHLAEMRPSRDLGFYLRFFEQYTQSHALVDPSGQHLLVGGGMVGHGDPDATPRLWRVGVWDGTIEEVTEGLFGAWRPRAVLAPAG